MPDPARQRRRLMPLIVVVTVAGFLPNSGCQTRLPAIDGHEVTITADNFDAEVMQSDLPVLLDFWAEWCGPCRQLEPVVAHLSVNYEGRLKVGKVNVDDEPELSARFEVSGIPKLVLIQDGEVIATQSGYTSLASLSAWVDDYVPAAAAARESTTQESVSTTDRL